MKVTGFKQKGDYVDILNARRTTVSKTELETTKNKELIARIIRAEHSPRRAISFNMVIEEVKYWVSVHLTRHKFGIEHFVSTQRDDRTKKETSRDEAPQGQLVNHRVDFNPQARINISRKRLCYLASKETRESWSEVVAQLPKEVQESCVKDCIYRGYCAETEPCNYVNTTKAQDERLAYLNGRKQIEIPKFSHKETWE